MPPDIIKTQKEWLKNEIEFADQDGTLFTDEFINSTRPDPANSLQNC